MFGEVFPMVLNAVVPASDVVVPAGEVVRFAVEVRNDDEARRLEFSWWLNGSSLGSNGPEIEVLTGELEAGTHTVSTRISDGHAGAALSWKLQVLPGKTENRLPVILQVVPPGVVKISPGSLLDLGLVATDIDGVDELAYSWLVDGIPTPTSGPRLRMDGADLAPGEHAVRVSVSDGKERVGDTPVEQVWRVWVVEDEVTPFPVITDAWPRGNLRLPLETVVRFEVETSDPDSAAEEGFRWEVNGNVQATTGAVFDLDTTSDENALSPGAYRITCSLANPGADGDLGVATTGWTVYLGDSSLALEPSAEDDGAENGPPVAEAATPDDPDLTMSAGESQSFRIEARDPESDILSYTWLVNGVLQKADGPAFTIATSPDAGLATPIKVEVFASDGHLRPDDGELSFGSRLGEWHIGLESPLARVLGLVSGSLVLDNGSSGTTESGTWLTSGAAGAYGADSKYSKSAGATYAYDFKVPLAGKYDVLLWWTSAPSRSQAVPVAVRHRSGTSTINVDQRTRDARWNKLGSFDFDGSARVTLTAKGDGLSTCADAVCLSPVLASNPPGLQQPSGVSFVIDDGEPGTSAQGTWSVSSAPNPHGGRSLYAKGSGSYTFRRSLEAPGRYDVFTWWTEVPTRELSVPYKIVHTAGTATVKVDQRQGGGKWNLLGRYDFGARVEVMVTVSGAASVSADAVRFVPASIGSPPASPGEIVIEDGASGTTSTGTWLDSSAPGAHGGGSIYAKGFGSYTFTATLRSAGVHGAYLWYTQWPSRESSVPCEVRHSAGTTVLQIDQRSGGGQWKHLGDFNFGAMASITLRVVDADTVSADAIRLVPRSSGAPAAEKLVIAWQAPNVNADGTPLRDLAGFRVYVASGGGKMVLLEDVGFNTSYSVNSLAPGKYAFAVTAYDFQRNESKFTPALMGSVP